MQPLMQKDRYAPLDILRGAALFGVLLVNLLTVFRVSLFAHIAGSAAPADTGGRAVMWLVTTLIEFRAYTLFAFLFGVGVAIQTERASALFLVRRFGVLLAIGLAHLVLIWNGDILTLYAVCGLLMIPALRLPAWALALGGAGLIIAGQFGGLAVHLPSTEAFRLQGVAATRVYGVGSFTEILVFRWQETRTFMAPLLVLTLPKTLGLMWLGVAAWRTGLLTTGRKFWLPIFVGGAVVGIAGTAVHSDLAAHAPLAFAYGAAVLLWLPRAPLLAAGGQMALTNYLMQSVVFCLVFYGYGLGQFGRVGVWPTVAGGVVFYVVQLVFSRAWLRRFHFGPAEWLWRSLTYGQRQPMLRGGEFTLSHTAVRALEVIVFLALVPLVHGGLPLLIGGRGRHWGWSGGLPGSWNYAGFGVLACAVALLAWILKTALRAVPALPARVRMGLRPEILMQAGAYAWSRHPLYLAEALLWIGAAIYLGSLVVIGVFVIGAIIVRFAIIPREERALESYFGDEYREYRARVPAFPQRLWK